MSIGEVHNVASLEKAVFARTEPVCADWRIIFDCVHGAMYALGPFEVPVTLGSNLTELADINLKIAVEVWGAYGGMNWAGQDLREPRD